MPDTVDKLPRLPSLNALRAFAITGKHLNMRTAAAELHVTPSALSHQIRSLEEHLGEQLFHRKRQGLSLTQAGQRLHPKILSAFTQLGDAIHTFQPSQHPGILTVSMLSTFAMRWFIPRFHRFQQQHPDIEVRISTSIELVNFEQEDIDCAIRSGQGSWPDTQSVRLLDEQFTPVCSPDLPTSETPLNRPADLARHTLLHSKLRASDWRTWLQAEGLAQLEPQQNQEFETRNFAIAAALRGLGVAIIDPLLVQEELKDGRLIRPFAHTLPMRSAYYLVWPKHRRPNHELTVFSTWLQQEASEQNPSTQ